VKTLRLADHLTLPLDAVSRTFGILAVRGAGKSNTAAVMAEEMFAAGLPFVVIDPVGSWFGLRSSADGTAPGLAIPIFGGKHGDVPLERGAGELIADLVVEKRLTCVLDLSRFESESDKKAFLLAFARRLYLKNENPLHLFLEEADDYIPQSPMGDEKVLLRAWENIVRRGRARGLGMTLITQRSAAVAKMVLTQVETLFAMRTTGPQDIAAIEAWVKYHQVGKDVLSTLAGLEDGEAWVWSPHYLKTMARHQIRRRRTFDSGATPANVRAKDTRPPATLADIDLQALQERMAATIEKAKADDPKALRARIAELERAAAATAKAGSNYSRIIPSVEKAKTVEVLTDADRAKLVTLAEAIRGFVSVFSGEDRGGLAVLQSIAEDAVIGALREFRTGLDGIVAKRQQSFADLLERPGVQRILEKLERVSATPTARIAARPAVVHPSSRATTTATISRIAPKNADRSPSGDTGLTGPERKILSSLAELESLGLHPADKQQLGLMAGYTNVRSGGFSEPLGRLVAAGLVTSPQAGKVAITAAGIAVSGGPVSRPSSSTEMQDRVMGKLSGPEQKLLRVILRAYPQPIGKDALGAACGYSNIRSGGFSEPLGRLTTLGLVRAPARGAVVASPALFLEA
jgi:uncharacterized protein